MDRQILAYSPKYDWYIIKMTMEIFTQDDSVFLKRQVFTGRSLQLTDIFDRELRMIVTT